MRCRVEDRVQGAVVSLDEGASAQQAAALMTAQRVGSLVVTREGSVVGLFTEQDLVRRVVGPGLSPDAVTLGGICTRNLISIAADSDCLRAIALMQANRCRRLLVYRGQRFIGVVNLTDLAHALTEGGKDLVVNTMGMVTVAVAVGVIAIMLFQLPEMMQLAGSLSAR